MQRPLEGIQSKETKKVEGPAKKNMGQAPVSFKKEGDRAQSDLETFLKSNLNSRVYALVQGGSETKKKRDPNEHCQTRQVKPLGVIEWHMWAKRKGDGGVRDLVP